MEYQIAQFAFLSRVFVIGIAIITAYLVTPYDTSGNFMSSYRSLAAFSNWDGVYFTRIAQYGYEYEHVHAFFPLYPLLLRYFSKIMPWDPRESTILCGIILSNGCFIAAAVYLYRLSILVLKNELFARQVAYLFCLTPSGIFMSSVYTESLMCLLSFSGMYYLEMHRVNKLLYNLFLCATLFGLASATRSNGALLSLLIAYYQLKASPNPSNVALFIKHWSITAFLGLLAVGPQLVYFLSAIAVYCPQQWAALTFSNTTLQDIQASRPWCADIYPNVTAMYMFIQKKYWNVGFLKYYEWKQLPNFLLATPIILLCSFGIIAEFQPSNSLKFAKWKRSVPSSTAHPYMLHLLFLLINGILVVHIQVITRLLCACPSFYWIAAYLCESSSKPWVVGYFVLYTVLGSAMFSSFYPWT